MVHLQFPPLLSGSAFPKVASDPLLNTEATYTVCQASIIRDFIMGLTVDRDGPLEGSQESD